MTKIVIQFNTRMGNYSVHAGVAKSLVQNITNWLEEFEIEHTKSIDYVPIRARPVLTKHKTYPFVRIAPSSKTDVPSKMTLRLFDTDMVLFFLKFYEKNESFVIKSAALKTIVLENLPESEAPNKSLSDKGNA